MKHVSVKFQTHEKKELVRKHKSQISKPIPGSPDGSIFR